MLGTGFIYLISAWDFVDHISPLVNNPTQIDYLLVILGLVGVTVASLLVGYRYRTWRGAKPESKKTIDEKIRAIDTELFERQVKQGVLEFYHNRYSPDFMTVLESAHSSIWMFAFDFNIIFSRYGEEIVKKVKSNKEFQFRFLIPRRYELDDSTKSRYLVGSEGVIIDAGKKEGIDASLQIFQKNILSRDMTSDEKQRIELREHFFPLIHVMKVIDESRIEVEPLAYGVHTDRRFVFVVNKSNPRHKKIFDMFLDSYTLAFNETTPIRMRD